MDLSELERLEQKSGTLKLSQAMRIGAKLRPQCFDTSVSGGKSCALFAAAEALGWEYHEPAHTYEAIRIIKEKTGVNYGDSRVPDIVGMNDKNRMTREQIADALEAQGL